MRRLSWLAPAAIALVAVAAGCGGSSSSSAGSTAAAQVAPAASTSAAKSKTEPAKPIHLRIISPKPGAHTGQTLTVRVRLTGASNAHARFHYVLGSIKRSAGPKITFHGVAAGRHDLRVTLASNPHVHASLVLTVHPPKPPPVATQAATSQAPAPTTTSSPTPAPPPTTTQSAPPPPPPTTTKTSPPPSGGIPQGNGGDADGDNNGAPSDGDGLI
ncbi:MAG: hypothetical protein ACXVWT_12805 [Solirubrobacteraceae bacterium]